MTAAPLTYPTSAGAEPRLFLPPAGDFCQQRQKSPKTPLETAFQDFLTRVGCDFALTCPTRNRFPGFSRFKGLCLHSFPRCAVARRCPLPRWVPWCSTARVPVDIPSRRTTLSARTHTPCRAGPACPAAGMRFPTARRCGHRPLRRGRRACRITNVGDGVPQWSAAEQMPLGYDVPSARQCRAGNGLPRRFAPPSKCPWGTPRNDKVRRGGRPPLDKPRDMDIMKARGRCDKRSTPVVKASKKA